MKKLLGIVVLTLLWCNIVQALPECKGEDYSKWTNCKGTFANDKGVKYTGEFGDDPGKRHGKGILIKTKNEDVATYKGQWKNDKFDGYGTLTIKSLGLKYTGKFKDGLRHGHGREFSYLKPNNTTDYEIYVGQFKNGNRDGRGNSKGEIKEGNVKISYSGEWKNNKLHGQGKLLYRSSIERISIEGEFKEGEVHGQTIVYKNGKLFGEGIVENNVFIDSKKKIMPK
tara:strand:- start:46 stop:723 length:678 start_codon:yes stop_codon:yes gene_type:complete